MVSSGVVQGDSQEISQVITNYQQQISGLSGVWSGTSHDSIMSKLESFASEYDGTINNQMKSFSEAVNLYDSYLAQKRNLEDARNQYNNAVANRYTNIQEYVNYVNEHAESLNKIKTQIEEALASASSQKLSATPIKKTGNYASDDFVNYYQYNYSEPYSQGTIKTSGCGPTSLAMVLTNLTGKEITPVEMAAKGNGKYTCSQGTVWTYFGDMAKEYGVNCEQMSVSKANIVNNLNDGKVLILSMGPGHFTSQGHFIVVRGIDDNGDLIVSDPASEQKSQKTWSVSTVASEARQIWAMST